MSEIANRYFERDFIRLRPGMYIGAIDGDGLFHLAEELIFNSVQEALSGHATHLNLTLHCDGSLSVEDDGRGISLERHEEESTRQGREVTVLEGLLTNLRMGRKFEKKSYMASAHHGVGIGLKIANFLSQSCSATVWRDGNEYQLHFVRGERVGELQCLGKTNKRGTRVSVKPDPDIFTRTDFDFVRLQNRLRELAMLHPGLITRIHDERTGEFRFERGIGELVEELAAPQVGCSEVFCLTAEDLEAQVEIAFQFTADFQPQTRLYVNDVLIPGGGTPVAGLKAGVMRIFREQAKTRGFAGDSLLADEFSQRLAAVIALRYPEPLYAAATKHKLINPELEEFVDRAVYDYLRKRFEGDLDLASQQWEMAKIAAKRRQEMKEYEYES